MASVSFTGLWVNDGADLSDFRSFRFKEWPGDARTVEADIRTYAGGRRRIITRVGGTRSLPYTLVPVSAADVAWLEARMGRLVLVRDSHGRSMWAAYRGLKVTDYLNGDAAVDVTFESVTHDVSV